jgi:hypothetical protein
MQFRVHILLIERLHRAHKGSTSVLAVEMVHVNGEEVDRGVNNREVMRTTVDIHAWTGVPIVKVEIPRVQSTTARSIPD